MKEKESIMSTRKVITKNVIKTIFLLTKRYNAVIEKGNKENFQQNFET